jgi:hypothetical protein
VRAAVVAACALGVVAGLPAAARAQQDVARFAIVVGNDRPEHADGQILRYADDDAIATHRLLRQAGVQSLLLVAPDADTRRLYPDPDAFGAPRGADLDRAFATTAAAIRQANQRGAVTELLFFYSGHGDVDGGEGFLVLEDRRLTRTALHDLLAQSPATQNHVLVDACKSYFMAFDKGPGGQRRSYLESFAGRAVPARLANTGFVLSTSSDRDSHEWERYQGGILSHEVRSALRGAADADRDGQITYAELGAFLASANRDIPNARYRPDFLVRPPRGNLRQVLFGWKYDVPAVRLDAATLGHVYIETAQGERLLDAHPDTAQALAVHVPPERPLFVRRDDESAELVVQSDDPVRVSQLSPASPEVGRRGALHLAFTQLFASPFGARDVSAFAVRRDDAAAPDGGPPSSRRLLRATGGTVAVAAIAAGLALNATALAGYRTGAGASQVTIDDANRARRRLDLASLACYAVGVAGGLAWGGTYVWPEARPAAGEGGGAAASGLALSIALGGRF